MTNQDREDALVEQISKLQQKIDELSATIQTLENSEAPKATFQLQAEDFVAHRVFRSAQGLIQKWLGVWIALFVGVLGVTGYTSYNAVVEQTRKEIADTILPSVEQEIRDRAFTRLDSQTEIILSVAQRRVDRQFDVFASELGRTLNSTEVSELRAPDPSATLVGKVSAISGYVARQFIDSPDGFTEGALATTLALLNLRSGPGPEFEAVDILRRGASVRIVGDPGNGTYIAVKLETDPVPGITSYQPSEFIGNELRISTEFRAGIDRVNEYAKQTGVKVFVTSSTRSPNRDIDGNVEMPNTPSMHLIGQAFDFNLQTEDGFFNSTGLRKSALSQAPESVRTFIQLIRDDPDLQWGGDSPREDPVHIDAGLSPASIEERFSAMWN